jgi:restriction endonuclease S subunit
MPAGTFLGAGVKTVVLFFTKGEPTEKIWYYQCVPGRSLGKTSPLNDDDMIEFKQLQKTFADSENSWTIDISSINTSNYDLTVNNPNSEIVQFSPSLEEIITEMEAMDDDINEILRSVKGLFINETNRLFAKSDRDWIQKELKDISQINYGYTEKASTEEIGPKFLRITDIQDNSVDWLTVPYCKCTESDIKKYKLESGDIVFARTGATTGKSYFIENPPIAVFASYLIRLKVLSKEEILPKLVYYFFQSGLYWQEINKGISGAAQGGFNASKLGKMSISFPKSIAEQQSIIDKLDAIDHKINLLRKFYLSKIEMVEQAKLSSYNEAFENELIEAE